MGKINWIGVALGSGIIAITRLFWLEMCYYVSKSYNSIETSTCSGFDNFFFYFGVFTIIISLFGFFRKNN